MLTADRIHVVGGPGMGKSRLADGLGARAGLEVHHLDETAFEGPEFALRPDSATRREAEALAAGDRWVTEGIFVGWVEPLLDRADVIVWLDHLSWRDSAERIARRWLRHALREPAARHGTERFFRFGDYARNLKHLVRVLVTSREYWNDSQPPRHYLVSRAQVRAALQPYADKVLHVTTADEAEALLRLIGASRPD